VLISEVSQAINVRNTPGVEAAFRILIGYPNLATFQDADLPALRGALSSVCRALADDSNPVPSSTAALIRSVSDGADLQPDATYATAAELVQLFPGVWRTRFAIALAHPPKTSFISIGTPEPKPKRKGSY